MLKRKKLTQFRPQIRSRHPSHARLRTDLPLLPFKSIVRLGSVTDLPDTVSNGGNRVECNSIQGVKNSSNKLLMKQCFTKVGVKTPDWWDYRNNDFWKNATYANASTNIQDLPYPIVSKSLFGSRGNGNTKHNTQEELEEWMRGKNLLNYIFEKYHNYAKEYRLHISNNGCFYTCRKLLRSDAPEDSWQRHDDNSVWILEDNEAFKKPSTWNLIVEDCIKAKNALGLDICAFDVLVQASSKENPKWLILESCSAPSFGDITLKKYIEEIPKILKQKFIS